MNGTTGAVDAGNEGHDSAVLDDERPLLGDTSTGHAASTGDNRIRGRGEVGSKWMMLMGGGKKLPLRRNEGALLDNGNDDDRQRHHDLEDIDEEYSDGGGPLSLLSSTRCRVYVIVWAVLWVGVTIALGSMLRGGEPRDAQRRQEGRLGVDGSAEVDLHYHGERWDGMGGGVGWDEEVSDVDARVVPVVVVCTQVACGVELETLGRSMFKHSAAPAFDIYVVVVGERAARDIERAVGRLRAAVARLDAATAITVVIDSGVVGGYMDEEGTTNKNGTVGGTAGANKSVRKSGRKGGKGDSPRLVESDSAMLRLPDLLGRGIRKAIVVRSSVVFMGDVAVLWREAAQVFRGDNMMMLQTHTASRAFRSAMVSASVAVMDLARMRDGGFTSMVKRVLDDHESDAGDVEGEMTAEQVLAALIRDRPTCFLPLRERWNVLPDEASKGLDAAATTGNENWGAIDVSRVGRW